MFTLCYTFFQQEKNLSLTRIELWTCTKMFILKWIIFKLFTKKTTFLWILTVNFKKTFKYTISSTICSLLIEHMYSFRAIVHIEIKAFSYCVYLHHLLAVDLNGIVWEFFRMKSDGCRHLEWIEVIRSFFVRVSHEFSW